MKIITALWKAVKGREAELKAHLEEMVVQVRIHEPDCFEYILHQNSADTGEFLFYEQYRDQRAIDAHVRTPHFKKLMADTEALIEAPVEVKFFDVVL